MDEFAWAAILLGLNQVSAYMCCKLWNSEVYISVFKKLCLHTLIQIKLNCVYTLVLNPDEHFHGPLLYMYM